MFYDFFVKKEKIKTILKHIFFFVVQIAFSRELFGQVFPFGFSFAITRIYFGGNLFLVAAEYAISNIFLWQNFYLIISVAYEIIILTLYYFFKETVKIKRKKTFLFLFLMLSSMVKLYLCVVGDLSYMHFIVELILKAFALVYLLQLHEIYQKKFIFTRCSNLDYLYFSAFLVLFIFGIFKYNLLKNSVGICLYISLMLIACRVLSIDRFLVFAMTLIVCFGYIYSSTNLMIYSLISAIILLSIARIHKYLFLTIVLLVGLIIIGLTGFDNLANVINLCSGICLVSFIPQRVVNKIIDFFEEKNLNIISENLWYENQNEIKNNLNLMSKTLQQMQNDFKFLIVGKIDRRMASEELAKDVIKTCCDTCDRRIVCSSSLIDKQKILTEFIYYAIMKGSFSVDELGIGFRTYCDKTMLVANNIGKIAGRYLQFETSVKTEDESKLLISSELGNFAKLFQNFSKNIEKTPKINKNLSKFLKETLLNNMIDTSDVAVFENSKGIEKIDIVVENKLVLKRELALAISRFVSRPIQAKKIKHLEFSGLSLISFMIANELRAEFAISTSSKESVNGDNTMISKIDDNRFFVAIADGMGHGKTASKTSQMILGLIKNLFLIGIDINLIIESVNKLLIPVGMDNFSTLDIAIVDLKDMNCCFVKLGSSVSAIKHTETTEIISSSSLPVGIVQNLSPTVVIKRIQADDILILASDGVVDSFEDIEKYKTYINDGNIDNLQRFTDNIIFELGSKPNNHLDDMSIIAVKLLKNSKK